MQDNPYKILKKTILTEKSHMIAEQDNKYTFDVNVKATKPQIKQAVEVAFPGIKVEKVNTMPVRGKRKRVRYHFGFTRQWKKAIVTLREQDRLDII